MNSGSRHQQSTWNSGRGGDGEDDDDVDLELLQREYHSFQATLTGPHRHNWLNADEQGVDARRHVAFRSGSPKSLRAPRAVVTRFLAHARFQTAPTSLLTLQTCGGGLRLGRVKIMNSRSGTAACIGRAGL
ncbi:hypothetical protein THAOC_22354, partial [Thalassiosira oceanica]